jgi:alkanesulfonate monooxygenase SsuD/methylene tetrahydromethanopterin reductase-like flavin-dependent oxidoreductase (luciferase family)|tara:strand:+ start:13379 stop:14332 length:954 start_codon:yes stop_codon:yes gene_type:complete
MNTKIEFGMSLSGGPEDIIQEAKRVEDLGFEYLSGGEHFMRGSPPSSTNSILTALSVAAGATEKIRLLSAILLLPFYNPLLLAKFTTTLDIASKGRLTLGIGVGGEFPVEFEAAGINVKHRGSLSNEILEILCNLWTKESTTFSGKHFDLNNVSINPLPSQKPHPPIWVAGRRTPAMKRAVKYGTGWFPYYYSPEMYESSVKEIQEIANQENIDINDFEWGFMPFISIHDDYEEATKIAAEALGGRYLYDGDFANIVKKYCILGSPSQCIERIQQYIDSGAKKIIFNISSSSGVKDKIIQSEIIAKEIIPEIKNIYK